MNISIAPVVQVLKVLDETFTGGITGGMSLNEGCMVYKVSKFSVTASLIKLAVDVNIILWVLHMC